MKLLCISDETDSLIYSKNISKRYKDVDLVLSAGDLPLKYHEFILSGLNKDLYFVFGNHNLKHLWRYNGTDRANRWMHLNMLSQPPEYFGEYVDGKVIYDKEHDLIIAGLGGAPNYNSGSHQFTERQMAHRIRMMVPRLLWNKLRYGRYVDILLTHAAPEGINDGRDPCHRGFHCFLTFMHRFKPKYLLHGHVHLYDMNLRRESVYEDTKVINVFKRYVIDDDSLGRKKK